MSRILTTVVSGAIFVAALAGQGATLAHAQSNSEGFETDTGYFTGFVGGTLTRVATLSEGIPAKSGDYYGKLVMGPDTNSAAYTFHTNTPPQIAIPAWATSFSQSVGVFFDVDAPGAAVDDEWLLENSIENADQNWTEGSQFNVAKTASGWSVRGVEITTDTWITLESSWSDTGVGWDRTETIYDAGGSVLYTNTSPPAQIAYADAQYVGYTWLLNSGDLPDGFTLAIDNANLQIVPEPASLALLGLGGLAMLRRQRSN